MCLVMPFSNLTIYLKKQNDKNLDLICLNNPLEPGSEFGGESNRITLIDNENNEQPLPIMPKWEAAEIILDRIENLIKTKEQVS